MSKRQILIDVNNQIRNAPGAKAITKEIDAALRDRVVKESVSKVINRGTALTISTANDAHFDWWGNTLNIQNGVTITVDAAMPEGYLFHVFASGQNGFVAVPGLGTITISYQKKLRYTIAHLGGEVYRLFEQPLAEGGGEPAPTISGFASYTDANVDVYAERRQYAFSLHGDAAKTVNLHTTVGGVGETALLGHTNIFLSFSNFSTVSVPIAYNDMQVITTEGVVIANDLLIKAKSKVFLQSTNVANQLLIEGDYESVAPPPTEAKRILIDLGRSDYTTAQQGDVYWNNITSFPSGGGIPVLKDINGVDTALSITLVDGSGVQASTSANLGLNVAVGDYPLSATNDYAQFWDSAASGVWRMWRIGGVGTTARTIKFLSGVSNSGNRIGLFRVNANDATIIERNAHGNTIVDQFANVAPVGGNIDFEFTGKVSGTDSAYINVIEITW